MKANNGYSYSRAWFDFAFENPDQVTASHGILYLWLVEINNRLGWVDVFQITASECMQGMGCKSYNTYKRCFDQLVEWNFVKVVKKAVNQHQCNIVALSKFDKASNKALDKALMKHLTKQSESNVQSNLQSNCDIHKQVNHKPQTINHKREAFTPPTENDCYNFFSLEVTSKRLEWSDEKINLEAAKFFNYYESKGWLVGSSKMKSWNAAARKWMSSTNFEQNNKTNHGQQSTREARQTELERFKAEQIRILTNSNFTK